MNKLTKPSPEVAKAQTAAHYASVSEQIEEGRLAITQAQNTIRAYQNGILEQREFIRQERARLAKATRRKRIFARARFDLEQVDEE